MMVQSEESHGLSNGCSEGDDKKQRLRQRFQIIKKLGQGTYGKVQLAINKETQQEVAIKTIRKAKIENEQDLTRIRREIQIMASIQHPHIIHIYEVFENSEKIVLIMQYASGGELYDYLGCQTKLPEKEARRLFRQIAAAIYYCHKNKICHRDLKLENILLDNKGNAKIADFGLSNVFDERKKLHTFCGSPLYASPEIVKGTPYCGPEVDCWSLGVLLYTLVYGAMPFDGSNFKRLVKQISEGDYYEPKLKSKASGIIHGLLTVDVALRANIKDVCEDEWVNETYDHSLLKVSNDMFCLTPVSLSSLPALHNFNDIIDNNLLRNISVLRKPSPIDKTLGSTAATCEETKTKSSELNGSNHEITVQNHKDAIPSYSTRTARVLHSALQMSDFVQKPRNASGGEKSNGAQVNHCDNINNKIFTLGSQIHSELLCSTPSEEVPISNHQQHALLEIRNHPNECNEAALKNVDVDCRQIASEQIMESTSSQLREVKSNFLKDNIPNSYQNETSWRRSTVEQFRAWRANMDKTKSSESDSILPIFEVTSIIPKRSTVTTQEINRKEEYNKCEANSNRKSSSPNDSAVLISPKLNNEHVRSADRNPFLSSGHHIENGNSRYPLPEHSKNRHDINDSSQVDFRSSFSSSLVTALNGLESKNVVDAVAVTDETNLKQAHQSASKTNFSNNISSTEGHQNENSIIESTITETSSTHISEDETPSTQSTISVINTHSKITLEESTSSQIVKTNDAETNTLTISETESNLNVFSDNAAFDLKESGKMMDSQHTVYSSLTELELPCNSINSHQSPKPNHTMKVCTAVGNDDESNNNEGDSEIFEQLSTSKHNSLSSSFDMENIESVSTESQSNPSIQEIVRETLQNTDRTRQQGYNAKKLKIRSYSVDNDERLGDLEKILRRPRKYSLCALLAASFEFERLTTPGVKKDSDQSKKLPGKVTIPKTFDPSSESETSTPVEKKDILLIPCISVAENKQKIEKKIEKVKLSALSMKPRRRSETSAKRKLKKYTRSCTDVLQYLNNLSDTVNIVQSNVVFGNNNIINCNPRSTEFNFSNAKDSVGETQNYYAHTEIVNSNGYKESLKNEGSLDARPVPITRCCKKITFPPKCSTTNKSSSSMQENSILNINDCRVYSSSYEGEFPMPGHCVFQKMDAGMANKSNRKNKKVQEKSMLNKEKVSPVSSEVTLENLGEKIESNDSLNDSSFEKDSSDNDDELDTMIFSNTLDECESGDLWKFLKAVNNQLNHRMKKVKRCNSKSVFSRSKSQECKLPDKRCLKDKLLMRSQSKEEKSTRSAIKDDFPDVFDNENSFSPLQQHARSFAHNNDFYRGDHLNHDLKTTKSFSCSSSDEKYSSWNNLDDSRWFLNDSILGKKGMLNDIESLDAIRSVSSASGSTGMLNGYNFSDMSLQSYKSQNLYATIGPNKLTKSKRSQSSTTLSNGATENEFGNRLKAFSHINLKCSETEHSNEKRSKAFSDLDISYNGKPLSQEFVSDIGDSISTRFSKSLGSKLDFAPRSILVDSHGKQRASSRKHDDKTHKRRERRVSFIGESMKNDHANFVMESLAKAQQALINVDRTAPENDLPDDQGTLLEALKTHGYNFIMSQRLQQNEGLEGDSVNKRYSLGNMVNLGHYRNDELQCHLPYGKEVLNATEYANKLRWNRNFFCSFDGASQDFDELEYSDLINLNEFYNPRMNSQSDTHWCKLPNMWLYQNIDELKSHTPISERPPLIKWNEIEDNYTPSLNEPHLYFLKNKDNNTPNLKLDCSTVGDSNVNFMSSTDLLRNTESPIERLSLKLKALKTRCQQKKFDGTLWTNSESSELIEKPDHKFEMNSSGEAEDNSSSNDDAGNSKESVSDRIWRKSFYSRFNDKSTLRRRKSMLFESDLSFTKYSPACNSNSSESNSTLDHELSYDTNDSRDAVGELNKNMNVQGASTSRQNIPNNN